MERLAPVGWRLSAGELAEGARVVAPPHRARSRTARSRPHPFGDNPARGVMGLMLKHSFRAVFATADFQITDFSPNGANDRITDFSPNGALANAQKGWESPIPPPLADGAGGGGGGLYLDVPRAGRRRASAGALGRRQRPDGHRRLRQAGLEVARLRTGGGVASWGQ